jgi:hypothetical protein
MNYSRETADKICLATVIGIGALQIVMSIIVSIAMHASIGATIIVTAIFLAIWTPAGYLVYKLGMKQYDINAEYEKKHPLPSPAKTEAYPMSDAEKAISTLARLGIFSIDVISMALLWFVFDKVNTALGYPKWVFYATFSLFCIFSVVISLYAYRQWNKRRNKNNNQNQK